MPALTIPNVRHVGAGPNTNSAMQSAPRQATQAIPHLQEAQA